MQKSTIRYHLPMCSSTFANTRKPICLKITICSKVQNKQVVYFNDDIAGELQAGIDFVFSIINRHTQDFVIEHLTDFNSAEPSFLIDIKVNVFGMRGKRLMDALLDDKVNFTQTK